MYTLIKITIIFKFLNFKDDNFQIQVFFMTRKSKEIEPNVNNMSLITFFTSLHSLFEDSSLQYCYTLGESAFKSCRLSVEIVMFYIIAQFMLKLVTHLFQYCIAFLSKGNFLIPKKFKDPLYKSFYLWDLFFPQCNITQKKKSLFSEIFFCSPVMHNNQSSFLKTSGLGTRAQYQAWVEPRVCHSA